MLKKCSNQLSQALNKILFLPTIRNSVLCMNVFMKKHSKLPTTRSFKPVFNSLYLTHAERKMKWGNKMVLTWSNVLEGRGGVLHNFSSLIGHLTCNTVLFTSISFTAYVSHLVFVACNHSLYIHTPGFPLSCARSLFCWGSCSSGGRLYKYSPFMFCWCSFIFFLSVTHS